MRTEPAPSVRPPAVAGQFYPEDPLELRLQVEDLLGRASDEEDPGVPVGLIAPHAGYPYSGQTAAAAYRQLRETPCDTVIILAPSHREPCGGASIFPGTAYETPLGEIPIDTDTARVLAENKAAVLSPAGHRVAPPGAFSPGLLGEHAVEVHLPFLQVILPGVPIVPIVMDSRKPSLCERLADALVRASKRKTCLLIASSDLYHGPDYDACVRTDTRTLRTIEALDPDGFAAGLETGRVQACGGGPIGVLMRAARRMGAVRARVVARTNSSDAAGYRGDYVVGYGAAVIYAGPRTSTCETETSEANPLTPEDRAELGRLARRAVRMAVLGRAEERVEAGIPGIHRPQGAFVTLRHKGRLRGCVGALQSSAPLGLTLQRMAGVAALQDPRFPPVSPEELDDLQIEISVLTPPRRIASPDQIAVGRHGLWVRQGFRQGVLLPQVAVEQNWDRTQFLTQTCRKAQLPGDAWQHPETEIWTFSADIFPA